MSFGPLAFLNPWLLAALVTLPVIYWLLRAVPPRPTQVEFPPTRILVGLENEEKTADKTPWWLTLIRLLAATLVILALADPVLNPSRDAALSGQGPVVLFVDNGWAAASHWPERVNMIDRMIGQAESKGRPVIVAGTAATAKLPVLKIQSPADARSTAAALMPEPFAPDRAAAVTALKKALDDAGAKNPSIIWLHDGVDHKEDASDIATKLADLAGNGTFAVLDETKGHEALGLAAHLGEKGKLEATILSPGGPQREGTVYAFSARNERLGEAPFKLASGQRSVTVAFELPLELRNQVARIEIASERSAGSVSLIDAATQWHRVGLLSGESREEAQPLLAPLYYIEKALKPFADLAIAKNANLSEGLDTVFKQNISVLMLADIGTLTGDTAKKVEDFVKRGGLLVRFAGPRLEKSGDELLPVALRTGGRSLGGALSWSTPQPLAPFDENSPFAGLTIPKDVTVTRQVLADPAELTPEVEIWARLKDGTPLVTAKKLGNGRLVLFHVTANSDWSNLPMSGLFVDMLRRLSTMGAIGASVQQGSASSEANTNANGTANANNDANVLAPLKTLDGFGTLRSPPPTAEPLKASELGKTEPSFDHPPGYYGQSATPACLQRSDAEERAHAVPEFACIGHAAFLRKCREHAAKPTLLGVALALLFADILAVLVLQAGGLGGLLSRRPKPRTRRGRRPGARRTRLCGAPRHGQGARI